MGLKGSKTEQNLKDAFAGESQANRRYLYFANKADIEGQNDVAALFRSTAEGETGHAHGHLEFLEAVGDPATGLPIGMTSDNLPRFHRLGENVIGFSGYNGRGIAPGTVFGRTLAQLVSGEIAEMDLPLPVSEPEAPSFRAMREGYYELGAQIAHFAGARL